MFGGGTQPQPQQLNLPPPPTDAEEEALKKNTDCVYFLASPLTCKKGIECEYRHSDIARLNPRDCWYWLNGNCLNSKCAFRHPPLDGLLGIQPPTPVGPPSVPPPQAATTPAGKQGVPCVFFQKGFCLKGDRCPFFHAPQFPSSKAGPTLSAATPVNDQPALKKSSTGVEKSKQVQKVPQVNVPKPIELPTQGKPMVRVETSFSSINGVSDKYVPPSSAMNNEQPPNYRPTNVPLTTTQGDSINRSNNRVYQPHVSDDNSTPHYKDLDEFSREPSPGFDVLVDDDLRDSDYYGNEDQFGRARGHEGRNLNLLNDYETGRSGDYNSMVDVDRDLYRDPHGYDSYERQQYGWEEHRLSSEKVVGAPLRRHNPRVVDSPDVVEESDLRNLLAKQRRGNNGLRSGVSRDHPRGEDRNYRGPRRDTAHKESSVSSRLRGRIKMPGRSTSPVNDSYLHSEREVERGRNRVRYSPERQPMVSSQQGRLRDRIKGRVHDDFDNDGGRSLLGSRINTNTAEFLGPKRLSDQPMVDSLALGKRKFPHNQQSDAGVSFEGPKPLSEILKRKRGSESAGAVSVVKESKMRSTVTTKSADDQEPVQEKVKAMEGQSLLRRNVSDLGDEEGLINDEGIEGYDQGGEYEDDQVYEEEDYNENAVAAVADLEEEYIDEEDEADDDDDFAKKMGVMYS